MWRWKKSGRWTPSKELCCRDGHGQILIFHLQFADDTIFFGDRDEDNVTSLLSLLKCFQWASGLKMNLKKSKLMGIGWKRIWSSFGLI